MKNKLLLFLSALFMGCFSAFGQVDSGGMDPKNFFMEEDSVKPDFLLLLYPHQAVEDTVYCKLSVYLPKKLEERYVRIYLECDRTPDNVPPLLVVDGREMKCTSRTSSLTIRNGVQTNRYGYWYHFEPVDNGSFICRTRNLTFNQVSYDDKLPFSVASLPEGAGRDLSAVNLILVIAICFGSGYLILWLRYHREADEGLAAFVLRTQRLPLSVSWASTHFMAPLLLFGVAACLVLSPFLTNLREARFAILDYRMGAILFLLSLGLFLCFVQNRKLRFREVPTTLNDDEIFEAFKSVGQKYQWTIDHAGMDCLVAHTNRRFWTPTWGEQIFLVFDQGRFWINSVNDLTERSCLFSFGRTERNMQQVVDEVRKFEENPLPVAEQNS